MKAYLHLEDGQILEGEQFGWAGESEGEVVFTTAMTGYVDGLTDPSFAGQILVFTYPLIGNYGVPKPRFIMPHLLENFESEQIQVKGVVVTSQTEVPSHFDSALSFDQWLKEGKIPGVSGIDTRALTQQIREHGVLKGKISLSAKPVDIRKIKIPTDLVARVSLPQVIEYKPVKPNGKRLLLVDCGIKHGILRALLGLGYHIRRIPWNYDPEPYLADVQGVVVSNGPGDPKDAQVTIGSIQKVLVRDIPFLGICLGHQLLSLAIGADTYKLHYGHRGLNQPVKDLTTGKCYVTSQNHGYAVKESSIPPEFEPWFVNLNDQTNEGIRHKKKQIMSTQFHPEGCPGPFDTDWIFKNFI